MSSKLPIRANGERPLAEAPMNGASLRPYGGGALPAAAGPPAEETVRRYLVVLLRHKWLILALGVLGAAVGVAAAQFMAPVYQARSTIWMQQGLAGGTGTGPVRQGALTYATGWIDFLKSAQVIQPVVLQERLFLQLEHPADSALFRDFGLLEKVVPGTYRIARDGSELVLTDANGAVADRAAAGQPIGQEVGFAWTPTASVLRGTSPVQFRVHAPADVAQSLRENLNAGITEDGGFLNVSLRGSDRARTERTLAALVEEFRLYSAKMKAHRLEAQAEILREQLAQSQRVLNEAESQLESFRVSTATMPSESRGLSTPSGLTFTDNSAYSAYFQYNTDLDQIRRDRESIQRAISDPGLTAAGLATALQVIPSVQTSAPLVTALNDLNGAEADLRALLKDYTEEFPAVKRQIAYMDTLRHQIVPRMAQVLLSELQTREQQLTHTIAAAGTELRRIPERSIMEDKLTRQRDVADGIYRGLEGNYQQASLAASTNAVPDMEIIDQARAQYMPIEDPRPRVILMCIAAGLGLAILGALIRDRMDHRLRYPDQVTAGMGLNILGAVPALRRGRLGSTDMALAVEAFRAIQLSIVHAHGAAGPVLVTFTSPGASDGKSFVTSNLAIAFGDMGYRTLVIDGDVRRGTLHRLLGGDSKPGLTDFLGGEVSRSGIIQATRYPMVELIACGTRTSTGPKLLGSPTMAELLADLKPHYDAILVDSPPLGACVDPMILGTLTHNLVLVLRTGATDRALAESKLDLLDRLPVRVLGAILNDVSASGPYRYYSYMSGYEPHDEIEAGEEIPQLDEGGEPADDASVANRT